MRRHVEDSLAAADCLPEGSEIVDLGSGAGFPGVPLALSRPDLRVTLVEIRERRVNFLRHVVRTPQLLLWPTFLVHSATVKTRKVGHSSS